MGPDGWWTTAFDRRRGDGIINLRKIRLKGKLKSRWLRWVTCTNLDTVLAKWIVFFYDSYGTTVLSTCEKEIWSRGTEETRVTILFSYSIQVLVLTTDPFSPAMTAFLSFHFTCVPKYGLTLLSTNVLACSSMWSCKSWNGRVLRPK